MRLISRRWNKMASKALAKVSIFSMNDQIEVPHWVRRLEMHMMDMRKVNPQKIYQLDGLALTELDCNQLEEMMTCSVVLRLSDCDTLRRLTLQIGSRQMIDFEMMLMAGKIPKRLEKLYVATVENVEATIARDFVRTLPRNLISLSLLFALTDEMLRGLEGMTRLYNLRLFDCSIMRIDTLSSLSALRKLHITGDSSIDIYALEGLRLRKLRIIESKITNARLIGTMTTLVSLVLVNCGITTDHVEDICNLSNLSYLNLNDNLLDNRILAKVSQMTRLETLYLNCNDLRGPIGADWNLTNLKRLNIGGTGRSIHAGDRLSIECMTKLEMLIISDLYVDYTILKILAKTAESLTVLECFGEALQLIKSTVGMNLHKLYVEWSPDLYWVAEGMTSLTKWSDGREQHIYGYWNILRAIDEQWNNRYDMAEWNLDRLFEDQ